MIAGFFGLLMGIIYLAVVCFCVWLVFRAVTALEQLASAQQRSANTLADIAKRLEGRNASDFQG